jgi:hypothetical protein
MYVDIGTEGGSNDAGIFSRCSLKAALDSGELNLPDIAHEDPLQVKYHLLGDDAFGLTDTLMKPYPNKSNEAKERVFNFRCTIKSNSVIDLFCIYKHRNICCCLPLPPDIPLDVATATATATLLLLLFLSLQCYASPLTVYPTLLGRI